MKIYWVLVLSMVALKAHADPTACLAAAQTKGQVIYQCSQARTEHSVLISEDADQTLTLTFCKTSDTGIESGVVEKNVTQDFTTYATPEGAQGDAVYQLKTDRSGSEFAKRSKGDSQDLDVTCGSVGSL